jgi:hypothetical protein
LIYTQYFCQTLELLVDLARDFFFAALGLLLGKQHGCFDS